MENLIFPQLDREFFEGLRLRARVHDDVPDEYIEKFNGISKLSFMPIFDYHVTRSGHFHFNGDIQADIHFDDGAVAVLRRHYNSLAATVYKEDRADSIKLTKSKGNSSLMQSFLFDEGGESLDTYLGGICLFGHSIKMATPYPRDCSIPMQYMMMAHSIADTLKDHIENIRMNVIRYHKPDMAPLDPITVSPSNVDVYHMPISEFPSNNIVSIFSRFKIVGTFMKITPDGKEEFRTDFYTTLS